MHKAYRFRLRPNKDQMVLINKTIGCSRYVYNHFLNEKIELYNLTFAYPKNHLPISLNIKTNTIIMVANSFIS